MRDLIKKLLREEVDRKELESKISNWDGNDHRMKDLMIKVYRKEPISDEEYEWAEEFFKKEKESRKLSQNTMSKKVTDWRGGGFEQQNEIMKSGITVYHDIIKTDLSIFLNSVFDPTLKLRIGEPNDDWFIKNINDLKDFSEKTEKYHNNFVDWTDGSKSTIGAKIKEIKQRLISRNWLGIIEDENWSILNKVDTNYSSWAKDISKRQLNGDLPMGGDLYIIKKYFEKRNLEEVLPKNWLDILRKIEKEKNLKIGKMSLAHVDFLNRFQNDKKEEFEDLKKNLMTTTEKGDDAENRFFELITNTPSNFQDIKRFAIWGNVVDMVFGVDGYATMKDGFKLIQVKSNENQAKKAFVKQLKIPYVSVYPISKKFRYSFNYFSNENPIVPESFNQDYGKIIQKEKPKTYAERERAALEKIIGRPSTDDYFATYK